MAFNSSLSLSFHCSSLGPACIESKGILDAAYSMELIMLNNYKCYELMKCFELMKKDEIMKVGCFLD